MKLKGSDKNLAALVPQRFVLVIDVSGSMNEPIVVGDHFSLLKRIQVFSSIKM